MQRAIGRATGLRGRFLKLSPLNPDIRPRTNELEALVKSSFEGVVRANVSEGTKALARMQEESATVESVPGTQRTPWGKGHLGQ